MGPLETPIPLLQMGDKGGCPPHTTNSPFDRRGSGGCLPLKFSIPLSPPSPRGILEKDDHLSPRGILRGKIPLLQ